MTTSEEYEEQSSQCMVWAGNSAEQQRTLDAQLNALGGVQQALLAVVVELRRSNEDRDRFYTELLGFFSKLTEEPQPGPDGSLRSGQPAAAPDGPALQSPPCVICGKEGNRYRVCMKGTELTKAQWEKHAEDEYDEAREHGAGKDTAWARAIEKANERFGPCPEES